MKAEIIISILIALTLQATAFKLPHSIFRADQLAEAQEKAAERPEMIGILISSEKMKPG